MQAGADTEQQWQLADMQRELDKLSNQARFVQMIIDHKLSISKKKKAILIAELKRLNFKSFHKVVDASKEGELEPVVEEGVDSDEDPQLRSTSFDYLLGVGLLFLSREGI